MAVAHSAVCWLSSRGAASANRAARKGVSTPGTCFVEAAVASAAEQMAASVHEVSRQVTHSAAVSKEAVSEVEQTNETVQSLAESLGVSPRALQLSFRKAGLCGPAQVMLARRLNFARRDLANANGRATSVTETAMEHGFMHLGRFSEQYRRLFGESPSLTLRQAAKTRARTAAAPT